MNKNNEINGTTDPKPSLDAITDSLQLGNKQRELRDEVYKLVGSGVVVQEVVEGFIQCIQQKKEFELFLRLYYVL